MKKYLLLITLLLCISGCSKSVKKEDLGEIYVCDETFDLEKYYIEPEQDLDTDQLSEDIYQACSQYSWE